jgi:A nuclease family of the HNH/ENDO VII superfamily with conserved AHH
MWPSVIARWAPQKELCRASAAWRRAGCRRRRKYAAYGEIKFVDNQGADDYYEWDSGRGGPFFGIETPGPANGTCPGARLRRERELAGWRHLRFRSPDGQREGSSRRLLNDSLDDAPWAPPGTKRAWSAHHIVPEKEAGADDMRELMFRCHVHPNESWNGVYLRGSGLRKDKDAYTELVQYDKAHHTVYRRRAYHYDTQVRNYPVLLRRKHLRHHLRETREECANENRDPLRFSLRGAANKLIVSDFGVETDR